ncbi:DNA polymerase III subunit chi [Acidocella facilis]|uniref:DNA polymerase III subunit chi n=1 Tax=Acidocella facilis TaxID=525 RepID=UPI00047DB743|nr:DNA polymerase III subunit chi [Acidocella facilis]
MAEIGFYHLTRTGLTQALPALLGRTLAAGETALVACPDETMMAALDDALWQAQNPDWLPHGTAQSPYPELQPIFLTTDMQNPAGARFLFRVGGVEAPVEGFARAFDLFDGNDEAQVLAARARWKAEKAAGHVLAYWKQEDSGWVKAG